MTAGPEWVEDDAFVTPVLPASLGIDPVLAALIHVSTFLELSGDGTVDPDRAVEAMEHVGFYLAQLPAELLAAFGDQIDRVAAHARAAGWGDEAVEFLGGFLANFGLADEDESADD